MQSLTIVLSTIRNAINQIEMMQTAAYMKLRRVTSLAQRACHHPGLVNPTRWLTAADRDIISWAEQWHVGQAIPPFSFGLGQAHILIDA